MKRKFIVGLVIAGMVLSGVNIPLGTSESWSEWDVKFRGILKNWYTISGWSCWDVQVDEILINSSERPLHINEVVTISSADASGHIDEVMPVGCRVEVYGEWTPQLDYIYLFHSKDYIKYIEGAGETLQAKIWIDKGCGATYEEGERIVVYYEVNKNAYVVIYDYLTGGGVQTINIGYVSAGTHGVTATVAGPSGKETLKLVAKDSQGYSDEDTCSFYIEKKDPCEGVTCPNQCRGYDLWAYECEDGECVPDYIIEKNSKQCGYDPCRGVSCGTVCRGHDLWQQKCKDGRCVDDYIIERNSKQCGYDPCKGITCSNQCRGYDLWAYECEDGACVPAYVIERNSKECGYIPPDPIKKVIVRNCYEKHSLLSLLQIFFAITYKPPSTSVDFEIYVKDEIDIKKITVKTDRILERAGDIYYPPTDTFECKKVSDRYEVHIWDTTLMDYKVISNYIKLIIKIITRGRIDLPLEIPETNYEIIVEFKNGTKFSKKSDGRLPTINDFLESFSKEDIEDDGQIIVGMSPIDLLIIDSNGRKVGASYENGDFVGEINEIPGAFYSGKDFTPELIYLPKKIKYYDIKVTGTDNGIYDLIVCFYEKNFLDYQEKSGTIDKGEIQEYKVSLSENDEVSIEKKSHLPLSYLFVAIILLFSIVGFYLYRGKKGGMSGPPSFGERPNLAKKLDRRYETGKINKDEYFQKMKDLELSPENKILKKLEEKFARGEISKKEYLQKKRDLEA